MEIFITQDNDYIIELSKKISIFSSNRIICNITFKSILGNTILSLDIPDIEIVNIINNIYASFEFEGNIIYTLNSYNQDLISYSFGLSIEQPNSFETLIEENLYIKYIFSIYCYNNGEMKRILSFNISNSLSTFADLLYDTFINDIDEDTKKNILGL